MKQTLFPSEKIALAVLASLLAGAGATAAVSCGVKAPPTPAMQGFEQRYEPEVRARQMAAGAVTPSPDPLAPLAPIVSPTPTLSPARGTPGVPAPLK